MTVATRKPLFGVGEDVLRQLGEVFGRHEAIRSVTLYGSRAKGNWRRGADLDLCLDAPRLGLAEMLLVDAEIDDLLLPWKVDLTHLQTLDNDKLLAHIQRVGRPIYPSSVRTNESQG